MEKSRGNSGPILKNPCREVAWEEMFREKILERHRISGVRAGGISVADVPDVKHEIRNFLDNAALGKKLLRVVKETDRFFSGACRVPRAVRRCGVRSLREGATARTSARCLLPTIFKGGDKSLNVRALVSSACR